MFTKPATSLGPSELSSPVADAGAVLQFYSYILDTTLEFEAFLNSYDDTFNSNWSSENVYGRQDPIYTFQNTQRTIGVSFTIPNVVHPKEDPSRVSIAMDSLNRFFQFLYPRYEQTGNALTISQAPLVRVKFANMIANSVQSSLGTAKQNGLLTTINSISMNPKIEHGFSRFDVDGNTLVYPNFIDLALGLSVVHETGRFGAQNTGDIALAQQYSDLGALNADFLAGIQTRRAFPYGNFADPTSGLTVGAVTDRRTFSGQTEGEGSGQIVFVAGTPPGIRTADEELGLTGDRLAAFEAAEDAEGGDFFAYDDEILFGDS